MAAYSVVPCFLRRAIERLGLTQLGYNLLQKNRTDEVNFRLFVCKLQGEELPRRVIAEHMRAKSKYLCAAQTFDPHYVLSMVIVTFVAIWQTFSLSRRGRKVSSLSRHAYTVLTPRLTGGPL
jgi:hypothetical protein